MTSVATVPHNLREFVSSTLQEKHGLTLAKVLEKQGPELDKFEGLQTREFETSGTEFKFDNPSMKLTLESPEWDNPVNVTFAGYTKAMRMIGFPESVINKYPTYMMMEPLNYGFKQRIKEIKAIVKNDEFIAFTKPSIEMVSTKKLLEIMADKLGGGAVFERLEHSLGYTHVSILSPNTIKAWDDDRIASVLDGEHNRRKDVVCGGVSFQNSMLGENPLTVESYVYRLVCSNGMISADSMFKWTRRTETRPLEDWFAEMVDSALRMSEHEFAKLDAMRNVDVHPDHRKDLMNNIFSQYGMNQRIRLKVLENLNAEPPRNMYDVLQAITNVANMEEYQDNPHMIRHLQEIGGQLATRDHICDKCHSVLHT